MLSESFPSLITVLYSSITVRASLKYSQMYLNRIQAVHVTILTLMCIAGLDPSSSSSWSYLRRPISSQVYGFPGGHQTVTVSLQARTLESMLLSVLRRHC